MANSKLVQDRKCPVCDSQDLNPVVSYHGFQYYSDGEDSTIDLVHVNCRRCDALFMNPVFTEYGFSKLFAKAAASYGSTSGRAQEQVNWLKSHEVFQDVKSVMDIGCYYGTFLSLLPENLVRYGMEIDEQVVKEAKAKQPKINFFQSSFDKLKIPHPVELVTMFHVLEHLADPLGFLIQLKSQIAKNGKLLIEIPVLENGKTNDVVGFFNAQHTTHFSRLSVKQLLERAGWRVLTEELQKDYNGYRILCEISNQSSVALDWKPEPQQFRTHQFLHEYFTGWYASLAKVEGEMRKFVDLAKGKPLVIWGGGMHTEFLYHNTSLKELISVAKNCRIIDIDPVKNGTSWRGIKITGPDAVDNLKEAIVVPSSYFHHDKIRENLTKSYGVPAQQILKLYDYVRVY